MCGRYTHTVLDGPAVARRFAASGSPPSETLGRCNVCPTEPVAVVGPRREMAVARWGLEPWRTGGPRPINARSETAGEKRAFARLAPCLVLADGWYEWARRAAPAPPAPSAQGELFSDARSGAGAPAAVAPPGPRALRVPFRHTVDGGEPFAFAGLWDGGATVILTTRANEACAPLHDRMPCVLAGPDEEAAWLEGALPPAGLVPLQSARVAVAPANPRVNRAGAEGPELLRAPR